jgi:hypothetical protein
MRNHGRNTEEGMRSARNGGAIGLGFVALLATACATVRFPNSGWEDGRRTCGSECPGRLEQVLRFGGPAADAGRAVGLLSGGALLLTGYVFGPATWTLPGGDQPLCANIERGAFLVRVSGSGEVEWAACANQADPYGLVVMPDDGAVVGGEFENTAVFAPGTPEETSVTAVGRYDMFVARYDEDGKLLWVRTGGGEGRTHAAAVAPMPAGGVAVGGSFARHAVFGAGEANELVVDSDTGDGIFVARYREDGTLVWVRGLPALHTDEGSALAALPDGSLLVVGRFSGTVMLDTVSLTADGISDAFLARLDPSGTFVWAVRAGGQGTDTADALALLPDGTLLVTGHFERTATFGRGEAGEKRLESAGDADIYLARYDADGRFLNALQAGGEGFDAGFAVAVDGDGGAVLAGSFEESATFGLDEPMETTLVSAGEEDLFVARYDPQGALLWATAAGGPTYDAVRGLAVTAGGDIVVTGGYGASAVFGAGEPTETRVESIRSPLYSQEPSMVSDAFLGWFGR